MPTTHNASPHAQFVQEIKDLMTTTTAIADHLKVLTTSFQAVVCTSPESTQELMESSTQLSQGLGVSTKTLQDCLRDLATMGEAMSPVMESSPEASPALIVNLYTTFFRQLKAYYRDVNDSFSKCSTTFERGRAAFYKEQFTTSTAAASTADPVKSMPNTPRAEEGAPAAAAPASGSEAASAAKKKKKHKASLEEGIGATDALLGGGGAVDRDSKQHRDRGEVPATTSAAAAADMGSSTGANRFEMPAARPHEDPEVAALAAAAAVGGAAKTRRAKARKGAEGADAGGAEVYVPPSNEPVYLTVTTTVEDALGRLVRSSRPNFFSNVDTFLRRVPMATYFIRLVRPGSLALFVVKNYIYPDEDSQADLFCDVLDTEAVEVEPMESTSGEVVVDNEENLRALPVCGWRLGNSEDHTRLLYSSYVLVEQPNGALGRSAVIQDAFVADGRREEVLHVVTLVSVVPQFARVTVYGLPGRGANGSGEDKIAAIASLMRNNFRNSGFVEVSETDVMAAVPQNKRGVESMVRELRNVSTSNVAPTEAFHPHVQLASLDEPAKQARGNLTMGDVTRGVLRGGVEVLKAPLTVGRVVGGAVLDVTGASDAIRNSVEGLFRKTFPNLGDETVLDSFNCAWQEGNIIKQGYLFVTEHWLCFAGTMANVQFSVEYDEVKDVQKRRSSMFDNAIEIITHLNEKYFLLSFMNRDQAFTRVMQQWLK